MIDGDFRTLHIRCGSDIRETLLAAGFVGDFLEYADPVCEGPVPDGPGLMAVRARYLARAYGWFKQQTVAEIEAGLRESEARLAAAHRYERVVLWFEHDSFDQLVLARCLARLAEGTLPGRLELICIDRHPSVARFIGLGQLDAPALAGLWPGRAAVTAAQVALAQAIWAALRRDDPNGLRAIAEGGTPALAVAAPALRRHLQELPGVADGLSLTQRLVLAILADGARPIGRIFAALVEGREPLVFMGDVGVLRTVEAMARTTPPVLTIGDGDGRFSRVAAISDVGRAVLGGTVDYLSLAPEERWIGGVLVAAGGPVWRVDDAGGLVWS